MGGQISFTSSRFSSTDFVWSRPMNVVTMFTPSLALAQMTFLRCATAASRFSRLPSMVLG